MKVILTEKHITFNENYTITHGKTGMNIPTQEFLRGIFVGIYIEGFEYEVLYKMIINNIPIEPIRNHNMINLKENQDITKSIEGE